MRTNNQEKKVLLRRPEVRSLKIHSQFRKNQYSEVNVAEIRLCGNWLEKLGFVEGKRVLITTMKELLIVQLQPE
jgi:hypothetical protein